MPAKSPLVTHGSWGLDSPTIIDWRSKAVCRPGGGWDPDMWVVEGSSLTDDNEAARDLCMDCPVFVDCQDFADRTRARDVIMAGVWRRGRSDSEGTVERRCEHCGRLFTVKARSQARYCGGACRTAVSRAEAKRRELDVERERLAHMLLVERFAPGLTPAELAARQKERRAHLVAAFLPEVA